MNKTIAHIRIVKNGPANETLFVLGTQGSGKTTLIANMADNRVRFIILDTKDDFPPDFFENGKPVVVSTINDFAAALNKGEPRIIYKLYGDAEQSMNDACHFLMKFQRANPLLETWVIVDELNKFCSVNSCLDGLQEIMQRGRSLGIKKIFGAQWFGTIPTWARDGFSELWVFRHTDNAGLDRLQELGFNPVEVSSLPKFVCIHFSNGNLELVELSIERELKEKQQEQPTEAAKE